MDKFSEIDKKVFKNLSFSGNLLKDFKEIPGIQKNQDFQGNSHYIYLASFLGSRNSLL